MSSNSSPPAFVQVNLKNYTTYAPQFQRIFGVSLKRFWCHLTGFDILAFDDFLSDNEESEESVEDVLRRRFGDAGVELVLRIIRAEIAEQEQRTHE